MALFTLWLANGKLEVRSGYKRLKSQGDCETKIVSESTVLAGSSEIVGKEVKKKVNLQSLPSWCVAQRAARQPFYNVFSFQLHACLPPSHTPYIHCEKVAQLEGNVMGLSADMRLGFEMLIAADYQAAKGLWVHWHLSFSLRWTDSISKFRTFGLQHSR